MPTAVLVAATACTEPPPREPLREVYSPALTVVPPPQPLEQTLTTLAGDWRGAPGETLRADLVSWQGLTVLVVLAVILAIAFDYRRPRRGVLIDLLLMFGVGVCLFDVMRFFDLLNSRAYVDLLDWVFIAVFALTFTVLVRTLWRAWKDAPSEWRPNPGPRVLASLAVALLLLDAAAVMTRQPDDAGFFVNLGAQRLRERARLPYGDPLLTNTPGAAYAPLVYVAHIPFQVLLASQGMNQSSPDSPQLGDQSTYYLPPLAAAQLCALAFHLTGVVALFFGTKRLAGADVALAVVCLYCGSLAILGIGSDQFPVAGITFVSHIAPASIVLLAFAALPWPALSGALLVAAAGMGFYPAFMGPAWLGYYWRDRRARYRFAGACLIASVALLAFVFALTTPAPGLSKMGTLLRDSFGPPHGSGGIWFEPLRVLGSEGGIRQALMTPLLSSSLSSVAWAAFFGLIAASGLLARGRSPAALALLSAAIAMAATLVKPHATGTYMAWYYGLLLIGVCAGQRATSRPGSNGSLKKLVGVFFLVPSAFSLVGDTFSATCERPRAHIVMAIESRSEPDFEKRDEFGNNEANVRFLRETLAVNPGQRVLEIGSGRGALLRQLLEQGHGIEGVEINQDRIDESRQLFGVLPITKVDGPLLPFADASFDVVLSFDVFEHIPDSDAHLREVSRVLKPGGHYLLQTPNKWTNTVFETIRWRSFSSWRHDHCSLHSYRQLQRRFERNGFDVRFADIPVVTAFFRRKLRHYLGGVAPVLLAVGNPDRLPIPMRTNFYLVARKR